MQAEALNHVLYMQMAPSSIILRDTFRQPHHNILNVVAVIRIKGSCRFVVNRLAPEFPFKF